jgi:hypothetical protein
MRSFWYVARMWIAIALVVVVLYIGPRRQAKTFDGVLRDV